MNDNVENNKYIFAHIKIPFEVKSNGSFEPLQDYLNIDFSNCDKLPEKTKNSLFNEKLKIFLNELNIKKEMKQENQQETQQQIDNKGETSEENIIPFVTFNRSDIKTKSNNEKLNTSFKNKIKYPIRHTMKNKNIIHV